MREYRAPYRKEADSLLIELNLADVRQIFNSLDPAPFLEKDLDRDAEEYLYAAVAEQHHGIKLKLVLHLPPEQLASETARSLPEAIHNYFAYRLWAAERDLRLQRRDARTTLMIGLGFLGLCLSVRGLVLALGRTTAYELAAESLLIAGWVAMWRPLQMFLYEWWPIRRRCRIYAILAEIPVELRPTAGAVPR